MNKNKQDSNKRVSTIHSSGKIFLANAATGFSVTLIIALAARYLSIDDFSDLSTITAVALVAGSTLDFGLGVSTVKKFSQSKDHRYLSMYKTLRVVTFIVCTLTGTVLSVFYDATLGLGIISGSGLSLWIGMRTHDQSEQNYDEYFRSSIFLFLLRIALALGALYLGNGFITALAIYFLPILILAFCRAQRYLRFDISSLILVKDVAGYATASYISSLAYVSSLYVVQYFTRTRLSSVEVSEFGLILSLTGPLALVSLTIRTYLLPLFASGKEWTMVLGGTRHLIKMLAAFVGILSIGVLVTAVILERIYGDRFPNIGEAFTFFLVPYSITTALGFYNVRVHEIGIPQREAIVNVARFVTVTAALYLCAHTLFAMIFLVGGIVLAFELLLTIVVAYSIKRRAV